jgi:hypothetical protein
VAFSKVLLVASSSRGASFIDVLGIATATARLVAPTAPLPGPASSAAV